MRFFRFAWFLYMGGLSLSAQLSVGVVSPLEAITDETIAGEKQVLRMAGPRNGSATGVLLVRGDPRRLESLQVALTRVVTVQNPAADIGQIIEIHYATRLADLGPKADKDPMPFYDTLSPDLVDSDGLIPVVLHVEIPPAAPPGQYRGRVGLMVSGQRKLVDLELTVCPFRVPPPPERIGWVDLIQSPDSVAYRYGVDLYSQKHLELLEPSFKLLGKLGPRSMTVQVIAETNFGNDESMIPADARGRVDFSGLEGYMKLFNQYAGEPEFVIAYVWDKGSVKLNGEPQWTPPGKKRDGKTETIAAGFTPEHEAAWRNILTGIAERIRTMGWGGTRFVLGWVADERDYTDMLDYFKRVAPGVEWVQFTHGRGDPPIRDGKLDVMGMPVAMRILPYAPKGEEISTGGWNHDFIELTSVRGVILQESPPSNYRRMPGFSVTNEDRGRFYRGFSRIGFDFWNVELPSGGKQRLIKRFSRWHNLQRANPASIVAAGPAGALPTLRYYNLWEGIQENEAALLIEKSLAEGGRDKEAAQALEAWRTSPKMVREGDSAPAIPDDYVDTVIALYEAAGRLQKP